MATKVRFNCHEEDTDQNITDVSWVVDEKGRIGRGFACCPTDGMGTEMWEFVEKDSTSIKVIVKKPIKVSLRGYSPPIEDDDGDLYITVEPGEYVLHEIEEYDDEGDVISIDLPMMAGSFWTTDAKEGEDYEFPPVDSDHWSEKPWSCATKDEDVKPGHLCRPSKEVMDA